MAVSVVGKIKKSAICNNCFSKIEWDDPADEISRSSGRNVICPECGASVNLIDGFEIEEAEGGSQGEDDGNG